MRASETNLARRDDQALFAWAIEQERTVVTFDEDFAAHAYWNRDSHAGVVRLRLEPQTPNTFCRSYRSSSAHTLPRI